MRIVTWTIRLIVFVLLVAFGAKNIEPVTLRFFMDFELRTPLIVALFCAFALGVFLGILSLLGRVLRQRRQISVLKRKATPVGPAAGVPSAEVASGEVPARFPPTVPPL
jgi:putative membrane protein